MRRWVRVATEADLPVLVHLYREHHLQPVEQRFFLDKIRRDEILVALEDQNIRGYAIFDRTGILELPYIQEPILYPEEEHHGFDTKLITTAEAYLKDLGYKKIMTSCTVSDGQAITRNKSMGYVESGILKNIRPDRKDELVMMKQL